MIRLFNVLDGAIRGPVAMAGAVAGIVAIFYLVIYPLPWRYFPRVGAIFAASWLFLIISAGLITSAFGSVAATRGFPNSMAICVLIGLIWKLIPFIHHIPSFIGRWMLLYGCAGLTAHCLRRIRGGRTESPPEVQAANSTRF